MFPIILLKQKIKIGEVKPESIIGTEEQCNFSQNGQWKIIKTAIKLLH